MEKRQQHPAPKIKPRLIIHGGAGNIKPSTLPPERWHEFRHALLTIVSKTYAYMTTPSVAIEGLVSHDTNLPTALQSATHAVTLLENNPLFNSGHGAVFTRDGINELEASLMVSRGYKKRAVAVSGIRRVRNPIQLAKAMLEAGEQDLEGNSDVTSVKQGRHSTLDGGNLPDPPDVPSAQGHTHLFGPGVTESLAEAYGLPLVDPSYYFTRRRWDEHVRALERETRGSRGVTATWSEDEYLPQGTVGAVALDENAVICVATSTGGLTNKLTGRVGDTPTVGAGFWAEEWEDEPMEGAGNIGWEERMREMLDGPGPGVTISNSLRALIADCLPMPLQYRPLHAERSAAKMKTTRVFATSGTGNGDSFLRIAAARSAAARARWRPETSAKALMAITGEGGELQRSAGNRWGRTGEGEGGMIGIELAVDRDDDGNVTGIRSEILQDFNCGGMLRAWVDDADKAHALAFQDNGAGMERGEDVQAWTGHKLGEFV